MAVFFLLMPSEICLIILMKQCFQTFFILLVTGLFRMPCQIKQAFVKQKGNYFASLNNFIPLENGRCSKVYNFIEIYITHGRCVDHMDHIVRQKQVGFTYIYLVYTKTVDRVFRTLLLATQSVNILHYSLIHLRASDAKLA